MSDEMDKGNDEAIQELVIAINAWLDNLASDEQVQEDGSTERVMGTKANDLFSRVKQSVKIDKKSYGTISI